MIVLLSLLGRAVAGPEANINYAYDVMPAVHQPPISSLNALSAVPYLFCLAGLSALTVVWPGWVLVRFAASGRGVARSVKRTSHTDRHPSPSAS